MPLEKHRQLKAERMQVRELENRMKEEERARRVDLAARRELNKKRTEENARKSEIVQVVTAVALYSPHSKHEWVSNLQLILSIFSFSFADS